jgi:hypothetical protein
LAGIDTISANGSNAAPQQIQQSAFRLVVLIRESEFEFKVSPHPHSRYGGLAASRGFVAQLGDP